MARFKIVGSRRTGDSDTAEFDVVYLEGTLAPGDKFNVYDTHHPIICTIIKSSVNENVATLQCNLYLGLGWENQFAGAIVDTEAVGRPASFKYDHETKHQ